MLNYIVLDTDIHQQELAKGIHMCPPSSLSLPPPSPSHLSRLSQSIGFGFPEAYSKLPPAIHFTWASLVAQQ